MCGKIYTDDRSVAELTFSQSREWVTQSDP